MPLYTEPDAQIDERLGEYNMPFLTYIRRSFGAGMGDFSPLGNFEREQARYGLRGIGRRDESPMVSVSDANKRGERVGLTFDKALPEDSLEFLINDREASNLRDQMLASNAKGPVRVSTGFAARFVGSMLEPVGAAASFVPIAGPTGRLLRMGRLLNRMSPITRRIGRGAFEGAAGNLMLEPINYHFASVEDRRYGLTDSLYNMAVGGVFGIGVGLAGHGVARAFGEPPTVAERAQTLGPQTRVEIAKAVDAELVAGVTPRAAKELLDMSTSIRRLSPDEEVSFAGRQAAGESPAALAVEADALYRSRTNVGVESEHLRDVSSTLSGRVANPETALPEGSQVSKDADAFVAERTFDPNDADSVMQDADAFGSILSKEQEALTPEQQTFRKALLESDEEGAVVHAELKKVNKEIGALGNFQKALSALTDCLGRAG